MSDTDDDKGRQKADASDDRPAKAGMTHHEAHRERAARKLKENLLSRKQKQRARRAGEADETDGLPAANSTQADD